jgi:hypothetical protein
VITGYYLRHDGDRCALIRQDEEYRDEVVLDGLTPDRAAKLYWRYMRELRREKAKRERQPEPALFELRLDARPATQRNAAERYRQPTLFDNLS